MINFIHQVGNTFPVDTNTVISAIKGLPVPEGAIIAVATRAFALLALVSAVTTTVKTLYDHLDIKSMLFNTAKIITLVAITLLSIQIFTLSLKTPVNTELFTNAITLTQNMIGFALNKFVGNNF